METSHDGRRGRWRPPRTDGGESFAWSLLQAMPDGVLMVDECGRIVFANRRAEAMFGYARGELLGEQVEDLVPAEFRDVHQAHRARYGAEPCVRPMGAGMVLHGKRRDGGDFAVDISLSPLVEGSRRLIVAAVRPHNDAERDQLATELLDSVIHRLFEIGISLQSAAQGPENVLRARVSAAVEALDGTINEVRGILFAR